jgi:hypothetical protein
MGQIELERPGYVTEGVIPAGAWPGDFPDGQRATQKSKRQNIQQQVFAGGHPPNY